ncbi:energy-coupling factor ABC transporter permease [Undibacterium sp. SXout11W]|uniref:energy-coupling factor ABC transporter permease n=1 Tax=Undibacterium sp. SXout11W TaxID=3413050 RepID=UPI003BF2C741
MGIFYTPIDAVFDLLMILLAVVVLFREIKYIPWKLWQEPGVFSAWCASLIVLTLVWRMRVHVQEDLHLHLLCVAMLALMFGRALASFGAALAVIAYTGEYDGLWLNIGTNIILLAIFPCFLSDLILRKTQRYLPQHMFVYLFGNGFFGAFFVNAATGLFAITAHSLLLPTNPTSSDAYAFMLLLAWGEAFLIGFLITIFVVYKPAWVFTFDDQIYLRGK